MKIINGSGTHLSISKARSKNLVSAAIVLAAGAVLLPWSCFGAKNPYQNDPKAIEEGKKIWFSVGCTGCHGAGGGGGMCPSVVDDAWVFGSDDDTLFRLIKGQIPQQTMPRTFGQILTDDQIWKVLSYVRTLKTAGGSSGGPMGVGTLGPSGDAHGPSTVSIPMDERACAVVAANRRLLSTLLPSVPGYAHTYVLVVSAASGIDSPESSALKKARLKAEKGHGILLAKRLGLSAQEFEDSPESFEAPFQEVLAGKLDGVVVWAPLAGFALWELDKSHKLKALALKGEGEVPAPYRGNPSASGGYVQKCAQAIASVLSSYSIKPVGS
jgi:mono/diheme cytochrome c family protein